MEQHKIIKRLELIKNLISLEEESEIYSHVLKLKTLNINSDLEIIINHLQNKAYSNALTEIEKYVNKHKGVTLYVDPEIEAIRFEAKSVELQIQKLNDEKSELEKLIHEYNVRHNEELGELIIKILNYRKEKYKGTAQEAETKKDYDDFFENYETTKEEKIEKLTDEEKKELKEKYRKASKLCHPDVVEEEKKAEAHKIFSELSAAYERNDLKRVSEILEDLEQGNAFKSKTDITNEKNSLIAELERLRKRLKELTEEILIIKSSETFLNIARIKDWDSHFAKTKNELQQQLIRLENGE